MVETLLGLLGMVVWIVSVIAIAAFVTWLIVRISPGGKPEKAREGG